MSKEPPNPTFAEKLKYRRQQEAKEAEKQRKEAEEARKKKKPVTPGDKYGKNLCKYAWRGNVKRCLRCLRKGASVEYAHPISLSRPLHRAALGGSLEVVTLLVEKHKAMVNACDDEEWRPLHFAASKGFAPVCQYLVQAGADINAKDNQGNTALHLAAAKGLAETVETLLALGARVGETNAAGKQPCDVAATRRIARSLAGLGRDLQEEQREDAVTGLLRDENAAAASVAAVDGEVSVSGLGSVFLPWLVF